MTRAARISLLITIALFLVTVAPMIAFGLGLLLNGFFNCDIRDESGTVYGDCTEFQSGIVYSLLLMPWLMLVTMPFAGIPALIACVVTVMLFIMGMQRKKRG